MVRLTEQLGLALLLGAMLGIGLWTLASMLPAMTKPRLADRIAPQLVDVSEAARHDVARKRLETLPAIWWLFSPLLRTAKRAIAAITGSDHKLTHRLRRAGGSLSIERYRTEQATAAVVGFALGGLLAAALLQQSSRNLPAAIMLPPLLAAVGAACRDLLLRVRVTRRLRRIADEYPTVVELLSLSLSAGEGIFAAMQRVSRTGRGELAGEISRAVVRVQSGESTASALTTVARELGYRPWERSCDHIVTALERGAPLVEVLRAQAQDAREIAKRDLLEQAGRKEITMMVPLVLLVLPVTVLFAIYPSYFVLTTTF